MDFWKKAGNRQFVFYRFIFFMIFASGIFLTGQATCFATTVGLQWAAVTDPGLAGYNVYYQPDSSVQPFSGTGALQGTAPVAVQTQTSATISGLDPSHSYYFAVTAYDTSGAESSYSNIVHVPELVPPVTSITFPANNTTVSDTVLVNASASDNVGVTKVEFYVNGALQAADTATPYVYSWNTSSLAVGTYTLMTKAYDDAGNVGQSSNVSVTVANDTTAPTVSVTAPTNNATVSGTVTISASASDNIGVSRVELYGNGTLISASNVAPYSLNWNTTTAANGSYTLSAKAYDVTGNVGQSANVAVTVNNPVSDTTAPTVAINSPSAGASVGSRVSISASAADDAAVVKMNLSIDGALKATANAGTINWTWKTSSYAKGTHVINVTAYDAANNSSSQSITVSK